MGRALDNAMLNVGLKDVARGIHICAGTIDESVLSSFRRTQGSWLSNRGRHFSRA